MIVGIDGWNVRGGGVLSHLPNFLAAADPEDAGISKMIVWGNSTLLDRLPERAWLERRTSPWLEKAPLPGRLLWHELVLPRRVLEAGCDLLWCPTGLLPRRRVVPTISMLRNSLPFDPPQMARYGLRERLRLRLLGRALLRSMRSADGLLFVSEFGHSLVEGRLGDAPVKVVRHGIETRFQLEPKPQRPLSEYSEQNPFRFLYISHVHPYKNHKHLAMAVGRMRKTGLPVALELVGARRLPATLVELERTISELDPAGDYLHYLGGIPFEEVHRSYQRADAFVFPSSCENMPNTLIEAMSAGLPIASSNAGPMPEVVEDAGVYFEPTDVDEIARALTGLAESVELRERLIERAQLLVHDVSWERCARDTLGFIAEIGRGSG